MAGAAGREQPVTRKFTPMEQTIIYAIQYGYADYGDYQVLAAYTDHQAAEIACDALNKMEGSMRDSFSVIELAQDPILPDIGAGQRFWKVTLSNGRWGAEQRMDVEPDTFLGRVQPGPTAPNGIGYSVSVIAKDVDQAIQTGQEHIRQHRALSGVTYAMQEEEEQRIRKEVEEKQQRELKLLMRMDEESKVMRQMDLQHASDKRAVERQHEIALASAMKALTESQEAARVEALRALAEKYTSK